jgi:hypothetical protein
MVGDWQTTSQRIIYDTLKKEEDDEDVKSSGLSIGVRKRKFEGQEEEEAAVETVVRKGWGSTTRTYPGSGEEANNDLDALLKITKNLKSGGGGMGRTVPTDELSQPQNSAEMSNEKEAQRLALNPPHIKREESSGDAGITESILEKDAAEAASIKEEENSAMPGAIFKKRKAKPVRQR